MSNPNFSNILKTLEPDLLIYDFSQHWAAKTASTFNIPVVQFLTLSAVTVSFVLHKINYPAEKFPFQHIHPQQYHSNKMNDPKEVDGFFEATKRSCNVVLIKTFREIEGKYIDYLSELAGKKMVPVGPLVQDELVDEDSEIMQWLDKKECCSVVFVSFGSEYFLSNEEREEIAYGLEISGLNFIWVVRFPNSGERVVLEEALPKGFIERVGNRGTVVEGWASQACILAHSSVGGFVSHCGWSSIMESMKLGVPIIAMPMHLDQPINARLVEEVGVGVEVTRENNGVLNRYNIADVIRKVVVEKSGEVVRKKVGELSENMRMKGDEEIDGVVEELTQLCKKKT